MTNTAVVEHRRNRLPAIAGVAVLTVLLIVVAIVVIRSKNRATSPPPLTLYGNLDLRQVDVAFNASERIAAVLVQEGDRVTPGQVLARLDTSRLAPQAAQAAALVAAQRQAVTRLQHGSRPEEIDEAKANAASARTDADNARDRYQRAQRLGASQIVSQQDVDNARAAQEVAEQRAVAAEKQYALARAGPREEDIAENTAKLRAEEAQLALERQQLREATLVAPVAGTVRSRLMEPGEMASPQRPVVSLAVTDPKWVRAYVTEPDLGRVHPGLAASISVDAFPARRFDGWIGFVSPVAEFTPKDVQTEALRPGLVYEVRIFVRDSADALRLGMPATVRVSTQQAVLEGDTGRAMTVPLARPAPAPASR